MKMKKIVYNKKHTRNEFLIFGSPQIEQDEIDEVVKCLKSGWIGTGPRVKKFEDDFKKYIGTKYSAALSSCTAALHLSLLAVGIKKGDEVITTPMTFAATANAIIHAGATPIFVDVEKNTMNIDANKIEKAISSKTKAIIPVHFAGRPCNMNKIMKIAKNNNLRVIEDAAHAIESVHHGKKIGSIGDITCFSFYVTKNLVTAEGGMITTNNKEFAEKIQIYGLHGLSVDAWKRYSDKGFKHYEVITPGFKYNMTDIQASLGIHQLKRLNKNFQRRKKIWTMYNDLLKDLPLTLPHTEEKNTIHARHLYTILVNLEEVNITRDEIMNLLIQENIGTGIHYKSLHLHQYYKNQFKFKKSDFPNSTYISDRTISLPFSPKLSDNDVFDVVNTLKKIFSRIESK
jgi:dTDP-4-amino-4,6-dideoxygalactose transaminase